MPQYTISTDILVEPLSIDSRTLLDWIKWNTYSGSDMLGKIKSYAILQGKKLNDLEPLETIEEKTRRVTVIHYDGREEPTIYGIKYKRGDTIGCFSSKLAAVVGLAENERLLLGWCNFRRRHTIGGFFTDSDTVPRDDVLIYTLTAWRVPISQTYTIVDFQLDQTTGLYVGMLAPSVIIEGTSLVYEHIRAAATPFMGIPDAMETFFDDMFIFNHPGGPTHERYEINRLGVVLGSHIHMMGIRPYRNPGRVHSSASLRTMMREWKVEGTYAYRKHVLGLSKPGTLCATLKKSPAMYSYSVTVVDNCTLRLNVHFSRGHIQSPVLPCYDSPNEQRWHTAIHIIKQFDDHSESPLLDILTFDDNAPCAIQPPSLRIALKRHQLQNLDAMIQREAMISSYGFTAMLYTTILEHEGSGPICLHDPRTGAFIVRETINLAPDDDTPFASGGFLADDVGLGKTLSVIALCVSDRAISHVLPRHSTTLPATQATLVICPSSILGQWKTEIQRASDLRVLVYHGKFKEGVAAEQLQQYNIVLTTYATYLKNVAVLRNIVWRRAVFDESHTMGEMFARNNPYAWFRWCITATPLHNITRQLKTLGICHRVYDTSIASLYYVLEPMLLKHTKDQTEFDTPRLPLLLETRVPIKFETDAEYQLYMQTYRQCKIDIQSCEPKGEALLLSWCFQTLQRICTHGRWTLESLFHMSASHQTLTDQAPDYNLVAPHEEDDMCPICMNQFDQPMITTCKHWFCSDCIAMALARTCSTCPICRTPQQQNQLRLGVLFGQVPEDASSSLSLQTPFEGTECTSKINALVRRLEEMRCHDPTSKALVFCNTSLAIPTICNTLKSRGFACRSIHGGMPSTQRGRSIEAFQTDPSTTVFVLSMRSAAAGINLTAANHIFMLGPCVNRASIEQAIGRAHRFGQERDVTVHRMFMEGTVEEGLVDALQTTRIGSIDMLRKIFL